MAAGDTLIDTLFDGRYLIVRKLGSGGMANVYLAEDQELGRRVAIKILDDRHAATSSSSSGSAVRRRTPPGSRTRTSSRSTTAARRRGRTTSRWSTSTGGRSRSCSSPAGPSPLGIAIDYTRQILSRAPLRAPQRDRAPRHQAAQRDRRRRGPREGDGLRHRARRRSEPDDRGRLDHRHGAVPLARAGARRAGRPDLGSLLDRDRPLRAAHRLGAVHAATRRSRSR